MPSPIQRWIIEAELWRRAITKHGPQPGYVTNHKMCKDVIKAFTQYQEKYGQ